MSTFGSGLLPRCHFPPPGEAIDCAVSGGADSLALLVLAALAGCRATAFHVDHGLRPGSAREADLVAAVAAALGCAFVPLTVSCPPGPNLEASARVARFAALPDGVATGHTADDQAETVLLNLLRGAGPDGVAGMRAGRRHPILDLRRAETEQVVAEAGLRPFVDPSNLDPTIRRNRVRGELLPLMSEIAERDVAALLARFAAVAAVEVDLLDCLADEIDATSVAALRAAPLALTRRAIRRLVSGARATPYPPDGATVARVLDVVAGHATACEVGGGVRIRRSSGRLIVDASPGSGGGVR